MKDNVPWSLWNICSIMSRGKKREQKGKGKCRSRGGKRQKDYSRDGGRKNPG